MGKRFYVADYRGIPFRDQPEEGYTYQEAIQRIQREINTCIELWGGTVQEHKNGYLILDDCFKTVSWDIKTEGENYVRN